MIQYRAVICWFFFCVAITGVFCQAPVTNLEEFFSSPRKMKVVVYYIPFSVHTSKPVTEDLLRQSYFFKIEIPGLVVQLKKNNWMYLDHTIELSKYDNLRLLIEFWIDDEMRYIIKRSEIESSDREKVVNDLLNIS